MTDYTKTTDFTSKDSLPSGDSGKIIRGAEFGTEFDNIQTAVNSKSNINNPSFTGNITVTGTVDGRDIAADGTKLDTIETSADVTDTANVTAAGAVMDSELTDITAVKALNQGVATTDSPTFAAVTSTGNVTVGGTVDGRDVAADGTKLDTVETNADVTDATNVTAAGALMDSEVTNLDQVKTFDSSDYATAAQGTTADNALPKTGGAMTGAITTNSTFDGRDVATDGTKLDGIEALADVTDTTNVTAAGALMDSELTNLTAVKSLDQGVATTDTPTFAGLTTTADVSFGDNDKAIFGAGSDLQIYHSGSSSFVRDLGDGDLNLWGTNVTIGSASGNLNLTTVAGGATTLLHGNAAKLATTSTGIDVTGSITTDGLTSVGGFISIGADGAGDDFRFYGDTSGRYMEWVSSVDSLLFRDGAKALFGAGSDLQIYHSGSHSFISEAGTGDLYIGASNNIALMNAAFSKNKLLATTDGALKLYYDGSEKLATTSTGIDVTGTVTVGDSSSNADLILAEGYTNTDARIRNSNGILEIDADLNNEFANSSMMFAVDGVDKLKINNNGDISFYEDTGTTAKFFWDASAESLGIGTSSPDTLLHLSHATGSAVLRLERNDTSIAATDQYGAIEFEGQDANAGANGVRASMRAVAEASVGQTSLTFSTAGQGVAEAERMRIDSSGNVGIGTDDPALSSKLHVSSTTTALDTGGTIFASVTDAVAADKGGQVMMGGYYTGTTTAAFGGLAAKKENATAGNFGGYLQFLTSTNGLGNTEKMRITSTGLVGIGTDDPTSNYGKALHIHNTGTGSSLHLTDGTSGSGANDGTDFLHYGNDSYIINRESSGTIRLLTGGAEACRIDSSQNLLVGTTDSNPTNNSDGTTGFVARPDGLTMVATNNSECAILNRQGTDGNFITFKKNGAATAVGSIGTVGSDLYIGSGGAGVRFYEADNSIIPCSDAGVASNGAIDIGDGSFRFKDLYLSSTVRCPDYRSEGVLFLTYDADDSLQIRKDDGAEAARFDSSGNLFVGLTTEPTANEAGLMISPVGFIKCSRNGTSAKTHFQFFNDNGVVGSIVTTGSTTTYNTSSDARLKQNISNAEDAGQLLDAIQVRQFDWKADGSHQKYGMVAQELQTVAPEAVSAPEDPEDMMGVDYSKLVPMLVKEIQSLRARVAQLETN